MGEGISFNSSTGFFTLLNPTLEAYADSSAVGKWTCNSATATSGYDCRAVYQITSVNTMLNNRYRVNGAIKRTAKIFAVNNANSGIYATLDNYGDTYYLRGAITNNYVKFAGYYWRIVRINGDGTVRLIYQGTTNQGNGIINTSLYNTINNDNIYGGYMFGTADTDYTGTHANTNNSIIKNIIDAWYENNISNTIYESYLSDTMFCGDRSSTVNWDDAPGDIDTGGYGKVRTYYGAYNRNHTHTNPSLLCQKKNDRFTVNDTINGNGSLTYPIAILTVDEITMAGGGYYPKLNSEFYLYTGKDWWTMSPAFFTGSDGSMFYMGANGFITDYNSNSPLGVRPVINLKSNVLIKSGDGSSLYPYELELSSAS